MGWVEHVVRTTEIQNIYKYQTEILQWDTTWEKEE